MLFGRRVDVEDFEAAAMPHIHDLYRTALRLLGNASDAEDLVQECYMHAWKSFHRFELGTNCRAWLFKILFHRIYHHRRRLFNSKVVPQSEPISEDAVTYEPPVPDQLSDADVLAALESISSDFRDVVLLVDVHEFSYKEVADMLKIPVGTVMSRLSRARKLLRSKLSDMAESLGITRARAEG